MSGPAAESYNYKQFYPDRSLRDLVKFFYYFRSDDTAPERILPFGTTEITIRLDGENNNIFITNPATRSYHVKPGALHSTVGICFQPWAVNYLFKVPQHLLSNAKLPLADVLGGEFRTLAGMLKGVTGYPEVISLLQTYLISNINGTHNPLIMDAVQYIDGQNGLIDIRDLYKRYNISERRLQQLFSNAIGMSPKKYCLLKRFHLAVTGLNTRTNLTTLALGLHYYDQAHFINDFKSFAGICPGDFLREKNTLNRINADAYFRN